MAEGVALGVVTEAAKAIGQLLMGRIITEIEMAWRFKDDLEKLRLEFLDLQLLLTDVENATPVDKRSRVIDWVLKVKDAAYVADDIMDDCHYEIIRREREKKKKQLKKQSQEFVDDTSKKKKEPKERSKFFRGISKQKTEPKEMFEELSHDTSKEEKKESKKPKEMFEELSHDTSKEEKKESKEKLEESFHHISKEKKQLTEKLKKLCHDTSKKTKELQDKLLLNEFHDTSKNKKELKEKLKELFHDIMTHRVRDALATFVDLNKKGEGMGLTKNRIAVGTSTEKDERSDKLSQARQHADANATKFVGRKNDMQTLVQILCPPSDKKDLISTVVIYGIGGLGKTTFARRLFNSKDVKKHFKPRFWISVRKDFNIDRILKEMLQYVAPNNGNLSNIDTIKQKLEEELMDKRYLLVLDDVWSTDQELWSCLENALQEIGGLKGCKILITTRFKEVITSSETVSKEVITSSETVYKHLLGELSEEDGWALLKQSVLLGGTCTKFSDLEESGRRIVVEKCKGVPLAIKAIGGILRSKQLPREWKKIENSQIWDLPQNDENQILPSLRLTFDHLPSPSLKQCFAYCAAFYRKGNLMKKDELVSIWLAQRFIDGSERENMTMEEIGEEYLKDLLNYALLEEVKGGAQGYKMHDLVYDLAVDVCGKDLLFWKPEDDQKLDSCRHLVIDTEDVEALSNLPITKTLMKLRTISNGLPPNVWAQAKYLRTLSLDGCDIKVLPSSIDVLKLLRFLSLSNNPILTLPDSVGKLYLLQTLRLLNCFNMTVLPARLYRLTNLIHIPTTTPMLASRGLLELTNLHTLPRLVLGADEDGWSLGELGDLQNLMGEVHISGLEHVKTKENASKADLARKAKVLNITLAWAKKRDVISGESYDKDVLDGLQPHPNITSLELQNFFGLTFPSWMVRMTVVSEGSPSLLKNLTSFKLLNCSRCQMLPTLGHLPYLKYLVLKGLKEVGRIGNDFYGVSLNQSNNRESFPSLTELEISDFKSLETWALPSTGEETKVFPLLVVIKLTGCPELETIPALDYFKSLKTLQLTNVGIKSLDIKKHRPSPMLSPEVSTEIGSESLKITEQNPSCMVLETLEICYCKKLESVPSELKFAASLKTLKVNDCPALTSLPDDLFDGLISLSELLIYRCEALNNIPTSLEKCGSLAALKIEDCPSLEGKMPNFRKLQGLRKLYKSGNHVTFMKSMLKEVEHLPNLTTLIIGGFSNEKDQESYFSDVSPIQKNQSLTNLYLVGSPNIKSLPEQLQLLTGIKVLGIYKNLKNFPHGWVVFHLSRTYG